MRKRILLIACAAALVAARSASADVGLVLNESLGTGADRISSTGHSAVYFSRICAKTPVEMRLCRADEAGSVLSTYTGFGESKPFEWNLAPLGVFLYGAEDPRSWPLVGTEKIKAILEQEYREKYLMAYCRTARCTTSDKADWKEMVGAGLSRNIYIFVAETSVEQDRELIETFNSMPNRNHFNAATRNCADFARNVINTYFPNSTKRDWLNDFGMSSPKAIARSFTRYARRHPEIRYHVLHFAQLPGTIERSKEVRDGTEQLFHSKLFIIPLALFANYVIPAAITCYELTGRFNPEKELERRPSERAAEIASELAAAKARKDKPRVEQLQAEERRERARVLGSKEDWQGYRRELKAMMEEAVEEGIIPNRNAAGKILKQLEKNGRPFEDENGELWMEASESGRTVRVGLSRSTIVSPGSDPDLAYGLLLARTERMLRKRKRNRETLLVFEGDWALLEAARSRNPAIAANSKPAAREGAGIPGHAAGILSHEND